jgi:hypothetical protein
MPTASENGIQPHHRLQQGRGELEGEGDQPDLAEAEGEFRLEQRIDRRQQRLHHVVQQVAEAQRHQNDKSGRLGRLPGGRCRAAAHGDVRR